MTALLATATGFDLYGAVALIVGAPLYVAAVCRQRRVCAWCGKRESRWPWQMFAIWKSATYPVDLCSFECSRKWHDKKPTERGKYMLSPSSPPDSPLMQVDHAQPVPSSPDSGESRSSAAGPESEQADWRRAGAPPHEASSYACERTCRVEALHDAAVMDLAMLVQILWARYPAFMPPAELVDFMDSLPDDLLHALMASTGHTHKAASWESNHPTCDLIRRLENGSS